LALWGSAVCLAAAPKSSTYDARYITDSSAKLRGGTVDDGGEACQFRFRYWEDGTDEIKFTGWEGALRSGDIAADQTDGLKPGALYHFVLELRNSTGSDTNGASRQFMTLARLNISSTLGGAVIMPGTGSFTHEVGTSVQVEVQVDADHVFYGWTGSAVDRFNVVNPSAAATQVTAQGDQALQANFLSVPHLEEWVFSGHADWESEAFRHWDGDDPPLVSPSCAKCHSGLGFQDFVGADGTEAGVVDNAAEPSIHTCVTCHSDVTKDMDSVVFPSGVEITGLNGSAVCMQCHQGRESSASLDAAIAHANVPDDDTAGLGFKNIHYAAAGATLMGGEVMGGYQYAGKSYDVKFGHVEGIDSCIDCHDSHSLQVKVDKCSACHVEVAGHEDLAAIRLLGSASDHDGDNNVNEGIAEEIAGLQEILYAALQANADSVGAPVVYDAHVYPYFFNDSNGNAVSDNDEATYSNKYSFTARLLRAAYNYQASMKDPGAFAHNGKYMIQLLYDSIEDLDPDLAAGLTRNDGGHFAGSQEAFRHWDDDGEVSERCSKCHTADGLALFLDKGITISQSVSNGLRCSTCHDAIPAFTRRETGVVAFPSGALLDTGDNDSNLCSNCHQGRESGSGVAAVIAGVDDDTVMQGQRFINVHYRPAGATRFGTEANGAYEYADKAYMGFFMHEEPVDACTECHDAHSGQVDVLLCSECHRGIQVTADIRKYHADFDGDGNIDEGVAAEIETLHSALLAALQTYAADVLGVPIVYAANYPYFFDDAGARYTSFTPRLLKAAYNYQFVAKDPGAFAHNPDYVIQVLYDGLEDLGADVAGMFRPY